MRKKELGLSTHEIGRKTVITAPTGAVYLSEFMETLPAGILNKKDCCIGKWRKCYCCLSYETTDNQ